MQLHAYAHNSVQLHAIACKSMQMHRFACICTQLHLPLVLKRLPLAQPLALASLSFGRSLDSKVCLWPGPLPQQVYLLAGPLVPKSFSLSRPSDSTALAVWLIPAYVRFCNPWYTRPAQKCIPSIQQNIKDLDRICRSLLIGALRWNLQPDRTCIPWSITALRWNLNPGRICKPWLPGALRWNPPVMNLDGIDRGIAMTLGIYSASVYLSCHLTLSAEILQDLSGAYLHTHKHPCIFFNRPGKNHRMIHIHLSKHTNNIKHSRQLCNCMKALLASRTLYDALGICNEKLELLQHQAPARLPTICLSILCHNIQPWVGDHHE